MQAWWDHGLGCRNPATGSIVFISVGENSPVKKKTRKNKIKTTPGLSLTLDIGLLFTS